MGKRGMGWGRGGWDGGEGDGMGERVRGCSIAMKS